MGIVDRLKRAFRAPRARQPTCPSGYQLDPNTGEKVCIDDFVIDVETGELVTPAEAERRAGRREAFTPAPALVWDPYGEEWVTQEEKTRRDFEREAREERRATGKERYDHATGEWVPRQEWERREAERARLRAAMRGSPLEGRTLPHLGSELSDRIRITPGGVATVGDQPATEALAPPGTVEGDFDFLDRLRGPERREAEDGLRMQAVILAALAVVLGAVIVTRARG